jgi:hypothetical protein
MRELANFIGELGGDSWTTQAVALIVAGALALAAAVITAIVTVRQGNANRRATAKQAADAAAKDRELADKSAEKDRELAQQSSVKDRELAAETGDRERELKAREHWWLRFKAVCDDLTSQDPKRKAIALVLMEKLAESHWADKNDKLMIVSVLAELRRADEQR